MTVLSDQTLRHHISTGYIGWKGEAHIQPASIDMTLGRSFRTFENHVVSTIDLGDKNRLDPTHQHLSDEFCLHPGEFALATTAEHVTVPPELVAQVNGKSSLGRLGLIVHATAGFIDPGFSGQITLELSNLLRVPIVLHSGMRVAQICFMKLDRPCAKPYGSEGLGSHYQNQTEATASRYEG